MRLSFKQGIAKHQTDVNGNPIFLQRSASSGEYVNLIVSPTSTLLVFSHGDAAYLVEENKTVLNAWGPLVGSSTKYLYWDVNLLTGALTRGFTSLPVMYTSAAPVNPEVDQHWFNSITNVMNVWNGTKYVKKLRVFAGYVTSGAVVHPAPLGTQAGLIGDFEAGAIILDSTGQPLRQSDGSFVTSTSWLNVTNLGTTSVRLEEQIISGQAAEELPAYSLIQVRPGRELILARSTDFHSRVSGLVIEPMYPSEVGIVITNGVVSNDAWAFTDSQINKPLFCGPTGQVTLLPPQNGVLQQIGFVYDTKSIFISIKVAVVLDDPNSEITPPPPTPTTPPIANFTAYPLAGVAPLSVDFENTSVSSTGVQWDFENDGFIDSTTLNPTHLFAEPGNYTVRLVATNSIGNDEEIKVNYISVLDPNLNATDTNLGISFVAPETILQGSVFTVQVRTSNDGLIDATQVSRVIGFKSNNGSQIAVVMVPDGATVSHDGAITYVTLPALDMIPGEILNSVIRVQPSGSARSVIVSGKISSPEHDAELLDNTSSVTVQVRT